MARLEFDESLANQLEVLYDRRDLVLRRRLVSEAVAARPGERLLDVGCGPGFYSAELLDQVGVDGSITGVDASGAMLAVAAKRVDGHDNVTLHESDATTLPVPDGAFDAVVSVQVLGHRRGGRRRLEDGTEAIGCARRVLFRVYSGLLRGTTALVVLPQRLVGLP